MREQIGRLEGAELEYTRDVLARKFALDYLPKKHSAQETLAILRDYSTLWAVLYQRYAPGEPMPNIAMEDALGILYRDTGLSNKRLLGVIGGPDLPPAREAMLRYDAVKANPEAFSVAEVIAAYAGWTEMFARLGALLEIDAIVEGEGIYFWNETGAVYAWDGIGDD